MDTEIESKYHLHVTVQGLPKRYNQGMGSHWTTRHTEALKWLKHINQAIVYGKLPTPKAPLNKATLTLIRHSSQEPDFDGLVQSFKPCVDALKKLKIILDDKMSVIGQPTYRWEKTAPKSGRIEITVEG